ncbi:MAG: glyoxalase/bleomycin resistance/extradiol dioxygenase family protein [Verrucomicrobiaceae bacterium]|nr:MAG: glyoxalase/bleomycin resistance/extradiol dioxygenase family protein [Verrucomicrobiaceae bacterium]
MNRLIFINLPVKDLQRAKDFFKALGFDHNPQFSDDTGACIVISEVIHVMVLTEEKFRTFSPNPISDARSATEVLIALSCSSREEVDELFNKALAAGGSTWREPQDHGFMYGQSFQDPDGHVWEVYYMDMAAIPQS